MADERSFDGSTGRSELAAPPAAPRPTAVSDWTGSLSLLVLWEDDRTPAENVQVNAAIGIGMLGAKRAGKAGRKALEGARTGGFARTREAVFKALAMLDGE